VNFELGVWQKYENGGTDGCAGKNGGKGNDYHQYGRVAGGHERQ